jgi:hypothetical protein
MWFPGVKKRSETIKKNIIIQWFDLGPIWLGADLTGADLTWGRFGLGRFGFGPIWPVTYDHDHDGPSCYLLPSLYAAAFVRRTTSSTDLLPFLKCSLYLLRFNHFIVYTGCGTVLKRVCHNTRTLLSYLHFYARTYKSINRLITKTHPSMHIIVLKSKTHRCGKIKTHRCGKI